MRLRLSIVGRLRASWGRESDRRHGTNGSIIACLVLALAVSVPALGCGERTAEPGTEEELLTEEADRQADSDSLEVDRIDDERSVERRLADASLATRVRLALVDANALRPFDFEAVAVNGRVLLRGEVETRAEREQAERVAQGVTGVRDVINEVTSVEEPLAETSDSSRDSLLALMEDASEPRTRDADAAESEDTTTSGETSQQTESTTQSTDDASEEVYHTVRSGDSLWEIARSYSVSIDQIMQLNDLQSNRINPGRRLRIE